MNNTPSWGHFSPRENSTPIAFYFVASLPSLAHLHVFTPSTGALSSCQFCVSPLRNLVKSRSLRSNEWRGGDKHVCHFSSLPLHPSSAHFASLQP